MQFLRYIKIATIWIALLGVSTAQTAFAGNAESGEFVSVSEYRTNYTVVNHGETMIIAGSLRGTLTIMKSSGGPFALGAIYPTSCIAYIKKVGQVINNIEAPCTMTNFNDHPLTNFNDHPLTNPNGDTLYMMATKNVGEGTTFNLLGGTGVYDGLTGTCSFGYYADTEYLDDADADTEYLDDADSKYLDYKAIKPPVNDRTVIPLSCNWTRKY